VLRHGREAPAHLDPALRQRRDHRAGDGASRWTPETE
jgi:hypothetical protein